MFSRQTSLTCLQKEYGVVRKKHSRRQFFPSPQKKEVLEHVTSRSLSTAPGTRHDPCFWSSQGSSSKLEVVSRKATRLAYSRDPHIIVGSAGVRDRTNERCDPHDASPKCIGGSARRPTLVLHTRLHTCRQSSTSTHHERDYSFVR